MMTAHAFLNEAQVIALKSYEGGEFAHLANTGNQEHFNQEINSCGDGLLRFIVNELKEVDEPHNENREHRLGQAAIAIETAIRQLDEVFAALEREIYNPNHSHHNVNTPTRRM